MKFIVTVNGVPISTADELEEQIRPIMIRPERSEELTQFILSAAEQEFPHKVIEHLSEEEPGIYGTISFVHPPGSAVSVVEHASHVNNPGVLMERLYASSLVGAFGTKFLLSEEGVIIVNPDDPPTIQEAYDCLEKMLQGQESLGRIESYSTWTLGAFLDQCEAYFGEEFHIDQFCESTNKSYMTLVTTLKVWQNFRGKRWPLSFTHHKEILYAKVDDTVKEKILDVSVKYGLNMSEQRKVIRHLRHTRTDGTALLLMNNKEELMQAVSGVPTTDRERFLFLMDGNWWEVYGTRADIPKNAETVINFDKKLALGKDAPDSRIARWTAPDEEGVNVTKAVTEVLETRTTASELRDALE